MDNTTTQQIIQFFQDEYSVMEISEQLHLDCDMVYQTIKNAHLPRQYKKFSEALTRKIISRYLSGETANSLGKDYVISHHSIANLLKANQIPIRSKSGIRKYSIDENYFDSIDEPNKAYILGLLFADGSNVPQKSTVSISLQEEDKAILESIRAEIKYEKPLDFFDYSSKNDFGYSYKNQYRLSIFCSRYCDQLAQLGMVANKSLILKFPILPEQLISHFVRGYFDGDGSVTHCVRGKNKLVTITSTLEFCNTLKEILQHSVHINSSVTEASNHNGRTYVLAISGKNQVEKFLDYIYQDAHYLFLKRKYQRYMEYKVA